MLGMASHTAATSDEYTRRVEQMRRMVKVLQQFHPGYEPLKPYAGEMDASEQQIRTEIETLAVWTRQSEHWNDCLDFSFQIARYTDSPIPRLVGQRPVRPLASLRLSDKQRYGFQLSVKLSVNEKDRYDCPCDDVKAALIGNRGKHLPVQVYVEAQYGHTESVNYSFPTRPMQGFPQSRQPPLRPDPNEWRILKSDHNAVTEDSLRIIQEVAGQRTEFTLITFR